jgi:SAM-dependent methyltransferase
LQPGAVTYLEGDIRSLPVDGPFDGAVCWLNSFGYYDDADCHRVLEEFRRVLRPGGKLAIDTMHHDGGVRHFTPAPDAVVVQLGEDTMVEVSTFDPVRGRMVIQRTVHRDGAIRRASYFVRLPTPPEWVVWLQAAGFGDIEFRSGGGGQLELDSWELVVVATSR